MAQEIHLIAPGGVEQLRLAEREIGPPGAGEVRLRQDAIGVNFIDIYHRIGLYPLPHLPAVPGVEGAGVVEAVGEGVTSVVPGDRVAYVGAPVGGYASERLLPAARVVRLPDGIDTRTAAAAMARGLTAHMLLHRVFPVRPGTIVLVHAGAGGLGQMLSGWAKRLGAVVIATVGSEAKIEVARQAGADHVLLHGDPGLEAAVKQLAGGVGVDVAYDGIGGTMLRRTLGCVRPFGVVASLGQVAGPIPPVAVEDLGPRRSISFSRPSVMAYANEADAYPLAAAAVFDVIAAGLCVRVGAEFPLAAAAEAQAALEAGRTTGSILLIP
ncbi:2-haloacrylate reductase [Rhodovastum atsumiense]|uniref:Quinone oxidoreductase n=1 Tax=Rhodovastum atsumiense TaxID=504468 RepID=A0A5M6IR92_9PROT|nr:quinone oxidoreductase [Rhodovastum atsumiense]KAA5610820.1 quinone oxidoreductase [Rhodovastum atsumiense]CAH2602134.1 2-haloacrylate reductase [Rhodovastum atsumiense]